MDPEKVAEPTSSRDDIVASIAALENKDGDPAPTPTPAAKPAPASPSAGDGNGGNGAPPKAPSPSSGGAAPAAAAAGGTPALPELKVPVSWKPQMRERWGTLPREIQEEVLRREREIGMGLQSASEHRKFQEDFNKVAAPYSQFIATYAQGNPLAAFGDYLKTATLLRSGSPAEKAQAVAMAIQEYGVPVEMLDRALAGVLQGRPQPVTQGGQPQPQQFRDPRVDTFLQEREQEAQEAIQNELTAFSSDPKNEFWEDVKLEVADILEYNASKGRRMTLQQAYDKACRDNDSVQATLATRKASQTAQSGAQVVAAARAAATPGSGKAPPASKPLANPKEDSVSNDIKAAIDKLRG